MPTQVVVLIIVLACVLFVLFSWWGVRKLAQRHTRSAVAQSPHKVHLGRQKVAVILNPVKAGAADARVFITRSASLAGWAEPLFLETTAEDPGYAQARQALEYGADVVIAGGGDGTVRAVGEVLRHTDVPLGLIPLGTGNLLARNIGLDVNDIHSNVQTALFGHQRRIDTALMETENAVTGAASKHAFLVIAGLGMDAEVMGDTNDQLKKHVGWLAYSEAGMRHMVGRRRKVSIAMDDAPAQQRKVRSVMFANCGLLPGGIDFIPNALIDDGVLDVVVVSPRSALGWMAMGGKILFQHKGGPPVIDFYRSKSVTVRTTMPVETQLDGDPAGQATDVTVTVEPAALLVRVPAPTE
ncbi:diacylglycerol/lipid kinase family protein [Arthrobacter sp. 35W]|uniref:diacylglycerol/lipid kinase family protein n=1 Tax=Arthrobacter sp. 35W TaxID=1132441 RepID=UPI0003FB95FE|nr:diacylglycerol kinase family protein [Arthrobacter sp. 35W]